MIFYIAEDQQLLPDFAMVNVNMNILENLIIVFLIVLF